MYNDLNKLKGIFPIIYCFFNKNNSLDKKIISEQIKLINKIGSNGIASLGLATEVNKLSFQEKKTIIEMVSKYSNDLIPKAVTIQGNTAFVYIVNAETVEKKNIKIGKRNFGKVSVVSGLNEGDIVISEGVSKVRNKAKVKIINP